nr:hypothetical protein [Fimbriiglobus sp.]
MKLRKWIASAAFSAGWAVCGTAAEPAKAPDPSLVSFGTLRAMPADQAKAKAETWLNGLGKLD